MAKRALAGKRWFYAKGQSDNARGNAFDRAAKNQRPGCWPDWAKVAYLRGWYGISLT